MEGDILRFPHTVLSWRLSSAGQGGRAEQTRGDYVCSGRFTFSSLSTTYTGGFLWCLKEKNDFPCPSGLGVRPLATMAGGAPDLKGWGQGPGLHHGATLGSRLDSPHPQTHGASCHGLRNQCPLGARASVKSSSLCCSPIYAGKEDSYPFFWGHWEGEGQGR